MINLHPVLMPDRSLHMRLLGGFQLTSTDGKPIIIPRRKGTALLAFLGAAMGTVIPRDKLASLLWGQSEQRLARQSLRQILRSLGHDLTGEADQILRQDGQMLGLDPNLVRVDAPEFEAQIAQGDTKSLTRAADLYRGEFLAGFSTGEPDFEEWLDQSRSRFRDLALQGLVRLVEQQYAVGEVELASDSANRALRIEPYREDIHRQLMRMYAERGMQAAALAQYRKCASILRRELGVAPDDETQRIYTETLTRSVGPRATQAGELSHPPAAPVVRETEAPLLVGFDRELAMLRRHHNAATQKGARLLLITGDGGSGKSALLKRFRWDQQQENAATEITRAHPAERSMRFAIWKDLLNTRSLEATGRNDLTSSLIRRLAVLRGGNALSLPLRHDPAADPNSDPWRAFDAMVELIRIRSKNAVLTLIVEDVHFADGASLRLLFYVLRNLRQMPVLFIASLRPEKAVGQRVLADVLRDLDRDGLLYRIELRALGRKHVESLVRMIREKNTLPMVSRARLREIWMLSDGNPALVVEAALADADGHAVPKGLHSELASRLSGLDDTAKLLAATASVIGDRFELALLAQVACVDEETALRGVETLIAAGVLTPKDEAFEFSRGRICVAQYRSLLPARRRQIHLAVAQAIAKAPLGDPAAHFGTLAHHFNAGGRAADSRHNELRRAQVQMRQGAYTKSKQSFRRLIKALSREADNSAELNIEIEARLGLAEIEEIAGNFEAALAELRKPAFRKAEIPTAALRTQYILERGRLNSVLSNDEIAHDDLRRATGKTQSDGSGLWQPSDSILEFIHIVGSKPRSSIDRMSGIRETARRHGLLADDVTISAGLCILHALGRVRDTAFAEARAAIDGASRLGNSRLQAVGMHVRGVAQTWCGDAASALDSLGNAIELATSSGDLSRLYSVFGYRGQALALEGRHTEAISDFDTALRMAKEFGFGYSRPLFNAWRADALAERGEPELALSAARAALKMAVVANRPWAYSVGLRALACALAHLDVRDFASAERAIRNALAEQDSMGLEFEYTRSLVAYARILQAAGKTGKSLGLGRQTQTLFRKMKTVINQEAVLGLETVNCAPCEARS